MPDVGTWHSGPLNATPRCFDVVCAGNCELSSSDRKLKLNFQPSDEIPDFFIKNSEGKIVFAEPKPVVTISAPKGHNAWLKVDLVQINGQFSDAEKYVCLGIKKHSEDEYYYVLHMNNKSRYVDVMDGDPVELIPLLSNTDVASSIRLVTPGEEVVSTNFGISSNSFDFGSVYRINTEVQESQWITETCELVISCLSDFCCGPVREKSNQLIAIKAQDGTLNCSANGISWTKLPVQFKSIAQSMIAYGNDTWCITNTDYMGSGNTVDCTVRYSTDKCETWN